MKHTRLLSILLAVSLFSTQSKAQVPVVSNVLPKFTLGVKVGANMQQITGDSWDNAYKTGIVGGAFAALSKNRIGVQAEVLVKSAKLDIKASTSSPSVSVNTVSLDIPVLLQYKLVSRLWIQVGPQFTDLISAKQSGTDVKKSFNASDFAGVIGLQAILPLHFTAGARYVLGMTNINNESETGIKESWNNRSIQLYLGFRFL